MCMFLMFSSISFRARRLWHSTSAAAEKQPKSIKNDAQIHQKSIPKSSKIDQSGAQERSKSDLGSKSVRGCQKGAAASYKFKIVGATWAIFGVILDTAGRQGDPKIDNFGTRKHQASEK